MCFDVSEGSSGGAFQDDEATFGRVYDADEIRAMFTAVATSAIPPPSLKGL